MRWIAVAIVAWSLTAAQSVNAQPPSTPARAKQPEAVGEAPGRIDRAAREAYKATASPAAPADAAAIKNMIYEQIKTIEVDDLLNKVNRAHNLLKRDGQKILKARAQVRLILEHAERTVQRLQSDADVQKAASALQAAEVQADLARLVAISDDKAQLEAFRDFLKKYNISDQALRHVAEFRGAQLAMREGTEVLQEIEATLNKPTIPRIPVPDKKPGNWLAMIRQIKGQLKQSGSTEAAQDAGQATENLRDLLKTLLGK